ncbi:MAG TPA: hypothetical protein VHJ37_08805 [Thermoleophilaceae bacterium]|jgi:hypothetical protein|nr:hypothetical protein [Thermoleophilaceae bacterium]
MPDLTAKRTLVKSPPELWGELSEVERLAKHLGAFGEITITKLEPEHTVAWEGEHASGTVSIEASGWGTKVTLTAELAELEVEPEPEPSCPVPAPPVQSRTVPEVHEPVADEEPAVEEPATEEQPPRRGFWSRLWHRRPKNEPVETTDPPSAEEPPVEAIIAVEDAEVAAAPPEAEPAREREPEPQPQPEPQPEQPAPAPAIPADAARAVLDDALDALGAAHHRPFSRG